MGASDCIRCNCPKSKPSEPLWKRVRGSSECTNAGTRDVQSIQRRRYVVSTRVGLAQCTHRARLKPSPAPTIGEVINSSRSTTRDWGTQLRLARYYTTSALRTCWVAVASLRSLEHVVVVVAVVRHCLCLYYHLTILSIRLFIQEVQTAQLARRLLRFPRRAARSACPAFAVEIPLHRAQVHAPLGCTTARCPEPLFP